MNHAVLALVQLLLATLAMWLGVPAEFIFAALIASEFFMREVTQAEYRWLDQNGHSRALMPWWQGVDFTCVLPDGQRLWGKHSITDVTAPAVTSFLAAMAVFLFGPIALPCMAILPVVYFLKRST